MILYYLLVSTVSALEVSDRFLKSTFEFFQVNFGPGGVEYWKGFNFSRIPEIPGLMDEINAVAQGFQLDTDWTHHSKATNQVRFRVHRLFGIFDLIQTWGPVWTQRALGTSLYYFTAYSHRERKFVDAEMQSFKNALIKVDQKVFRNHIKQILRAIGIVASWRPYANSPPRKFFSDFVHNLNAIVEKLNDPLDCSLILSCPSLLHSLKTSIDQSVSKSNFEQVQDTLRENLKAMVSLLEID